MSKREESIITPTHFLTTSSHFSVLEDYRLNSLRIAQSENENFNIMKSVPSFIEDPITSKLSRINVH